MPTDTCPPTITSSLFPIHSPAPSPFLLPRQSLSSTISTNEEIAGNGQSLVGLKKQGVHIKHSLSTLLLLTFLSSTAHAQFAKFVHVAPGIEKEHSSSAYSISTNPVLTIAQSDTNTFTVTIPLKGAKQHQQYWVIRCKSTSDKEKLDFRQFVWGIGKRSDIEESEVIQLKPDQESVTVQIAADAIHRTYIYRDYSTMVIDGGYYYCFDLPAYYRKQKAEQPAAQVQSEGAPSD